MLTGHGAKFERKRDEVIGFERFWGPGMLVEIGDEIAGGCAFGGKMFEAVGDEDSADIALIDDVGGSADVVCPAAVFYRDHGKGIEHLSEFLTGPSKMKDVRLAQSPDGKKITVFTRPQHSEESLGGRGKIGYFQVSTLEDITADKMKNAPIFRHQFADQEWGGVNAAEYIDDHRIGIIGHYARFDANNNRDYIGVSWILDTRANVLSTPKVILERSDLPRGLMRGSKRKDLRNVLFPGGFVKNPNGTYSIFGGEGDKRTFLAIVPNPFHN